MSELVLENINKKELPKCWSFCKVGDVCDVLGGKRLPKGHVYSDNKTTYPYVRVVDFKNMGIDITSLKYLKPETTKEISKYTISKNDLYISIAGSIGRVGIIPEFLDNAYLTENAGKLCKIKIDKKFLCHVLNSQYCQQQISTLTKSTTQPKLALFRIKEISLPVPPLNEQKRIVAKIEELFSLLEFVKQTLEKIEYRLNLYRRSLLKNIFNKIPSQILFSRIAHINPIPEKDRFSDDLDVSFLPMRNVQEMTGKMDASITRKFKEVKKGYTFFEEGDLLFAKITPCMENGKIAIAQGLTNKIGFGSTEFHVIRFKNNDMLTKFYFWYLIQDEFRNLAQQNMKGTAGQLRVPTDYLKNILVPHTSKDEQNKVIMEIEENITKIEVQQNLIYLSLRNINSLKHTILKQAFEGKLLPQDPTDEPAEILLEKIKQEKQKIISQTTRGKK